MQRFIEVWGGNVYLHYETIYVKTFKMSYEWNGKMTPLIFIVQWKGNLSKKGYHDIAFEHTSSPVEFPAPFAA